MALLFAQRMPGHPIICLPGREGADHLINSKAGREALGGPLPDPGASAVDRAFLPLCGPVPVGLLPRAGALDGA